MLIQTAGMDASVRPPQSRCVCVYAFGPQTHCGSPSLDYCNANTNSDTSNMLGCCTLEVRLYIKGHSMAKGRVSRNLQTKSHLKGKQCHHLHSSGQPHKQKTQKAQYTKQLRKQYFRAKPNILVTKYTQDNLTLSAPGIFTLSQCHNFFTTNLHYMKIRSLHKNVL